MTRAPSLIASISLVIAILVVGPFGQAGGSVRIPATHSAAGVDLRGDTERHDRNDAQDVNCGESLIVDATDVITTDTNFAGTIEHEGAVLRAVTDEVQFVQRNGVVVCIDAEGSLFDADGVRVAGWHLRPTESGDAELRIRE